MVFSLSVVCGFFCFMGFGCLFSFLRDADFKAEISAILV